MTSRWTDAARPPRAARAEPPPTLLAPRFAWRRPSPTMPAAPSGFRRKSNVVQVLRGLRAAFSSRLRPISRSAGPGGKAHVEEHGVSGAGAARSSSRGRGGSPAAATSPTSRWCSSLNPISFSTSARSNDTWRVAGEPRRFRPAFPYALLDYAASDAMVCDLSQARRFDAADRLGWKPLCPATPSRPFSTIRSRIDKISGECAPAGLLRPRPARPSRPGFGGSINVETGEFLGACDRGG